MTEQMGLKSETGID